MKYEERKKKFAELKQILVNIVLFSCLISTVYGNKKYVNNLDKLSKKLGIYETSTSVTQVANTCKEHQFQCKSDGFCIPAQWRCDFVNDCKDGSDENITECEKTPVVQNECDNENFFHCHFSRKCIPKQWVCDEVFDCGLIGKFNLLDDSDENQFCTKKCPVNTLPCSNGKCLHISKFCDGQVDCSNDELSCADKAPCKNLKCDYECKSTPHGAQCYCPPNQTIVNGTKCLVQKECHESTSDEVEICDQLCVNSKGRNKCSCVPGYERIDNKCYGINEPPTEPTSLFILNPEEIYKIILPSEKKSDSVEIENPSRVKLMQVLKLKNLVTMEVNFQNNTVCVMENVDIFCYISNFLDKWKMPTPDFLPLYETSSNVFISQFALDWLSRNWYFMDVINNFIFVCSYEMKNCRIIIHTAQSETVKFKAFALDPSSGFLFLTKYDLHNRTGANLSRYSLDGTGELSLIKEKIFYPHDLTLDIALKRIYFLDHYFDFIQQCDYDGGNRKFLQKIPPMKFHRITFFENYFFGAVDKNSTIFQVSKSSSIFKKALAENLKANTKMLKVFHQQTQPRNAAGGKSKVCAFNNKCEHLCVPVVDKNSAKLVEQCMCKEGFTVDTNGKCSLKESRKFIMFVEENPRVLKAIETNNLMEAAISPIVGLKSNIAFDVDLNNRLIYYTSYSDSHIIKNNSIEYRSFNGSLSGKLKGEFGNVQSIAYDWVGNNLFISSSNPKYKISAMKLASTTKEPLMVKTLVNKHFIGPSSIALDVEHGMLYWTSFAERYHIGGKIEMSRMDGTYREVLASKNVNGNTSIYWPVSLTYYKESRSLYWLDVLSQTIESINLDGPKVRVQRKLDNSYAQSMTILSNLIYWTDNLKSNINTISTESTNSLLLRVFYRSNSKKSFLKSASIDYYFDHVEREKQMACPGLWITLPKSGVCLCGDGFSMNALGNSCIASPQFETSSARNPIRCSPNSFNCKSGDECIDNPAMICDGAKDCTDGSDEEESPNGPCPKRCDHKCDTNRCIESYRVCDGFNDCVDKSDEASSLCSNKTLGGSEEDTDFYDYCDEFLCENSHCVMLEQRCDGVDDCEDNSDEKDCPSIASTTQISSTTPLDYGSEDDEHIDIDYSVNSSDCHLPDYYCEANHRCIPVHHLCDGISQCSDNSDESGRCSDRLCDHFSECQFFCHNAPNPNGYVCSCPQHMTLEEDGRTCSEPETCDDFSTCSHYCIQLNPTKVKCKCHHGYHLKEDNFTCESDHKDDPILLVSNRHVLRGIHLKSREMKNYYSMSKNLIGIDFYYDRHTSSYEIVWSDITKDKIYLGKLRGDELTNIKSIVEFLSTTEAVAIDWIGKNIYWIDASLKQIEVATKDGLHRTTLLSENISKPRSMALDSRFGFLFWSDWEEIDPRIERSSLAGEDRKSIFNLKNIGGSWPNGITLDYIKKRVFFLDAKTREIHTIDYEGKNHKRILRNPEYLHHPFAITIFGNNLFWTDWRLSSVITADKFSGSNVTVFYQVSVQPFDVKIMHPSRQPWDFNGEGTGKEIISPCENNKCSHLCLLSTNNTFKCACPHMMRLSNDNDKVCEKVKDIMFYISDKSEIRAIELNYPYSSAISTIYHTSQIMMPSHIAIHPKEKIIYWSDVQLREIKSVKLSTSITPSDHKIETILDAEIDQVHGFAVDWNSGLLFFSQSIPEEEEKAHNSKGHRLLVSNLKGEYLTRLLDDINTIYSIIIAPESRKLYYIMMNNNLYEIRECNMDGSDDKSLVQEDEVIQSLAYDSTSKRLYFVKNNRKIFYWDLKTDSTKLVNTFYGEKGLGHQEYSDLFITSLEVFDKFIYFGENTNSSIRKCDKNNCLEPEMYRKNTPNIKQLKIMALTDSSIDLVDKNGCMYQDNDKCDHLCIPKGHSGFVCKCAIGYFADPRDSNKCIGYEDFLVYSLGYELKGIGIENQTKHQAFFTPLQRVNVISTFDFDAPHDFIYYSDNEKGEILRIKKDGSSRQTILSSLDFDSSNSDWLGGIAVDWISQNIYWTDQKRGLIEVSRHDGTFRRVIVSQLMKPKKLQIDPLLGMLFFSTGDNEILRINLDGSNVFGVLKKQTVSFNDFVIDIENQEIYFCETKRNKIWKIDYDGNGRKELEIESINNPISLDIIKSTLYWAERGVGNIKSVSVKDLQNVQTLKRSLSNQLKSINIFSTRKQKGTNLCATPEYGGCEELCFFDGYKANCYCSHGYLDSNDNKTCRKYENNLFFSNRETIQRINVYGDKNSSLVLEHNHQLQNAVALAYDFQRHLIYYSDVKLNAICVCNFKGQTFLTLVENQKIVEGLALNPQNSHLFWTLNEEAEIRTMDMNFFLSDTNEMQANQNNVQKLIKKILSLKKGIDKLRAIVVEPCLNVVYYSNWNNKFPSISRIYITGYGREDVITTDIVVPNALTIDLNDKKLFWADARLDKIERCDYDGKNRIILAQAALKHPFSLAVFEDFVFWSDWTLHAVIRANKYSGNDVMFLRKEIEHPMGIVVAQDQFRNCSNNLCSILNGGCEDVCLPLGENTMKCECSQGVLARDNKRCLLRDKSSSCNSTLEFECKTGECIPITATCDGVSHCADNSDEQVTYCATRTCPRDVFFQCLNSRCILRTEKCDGVSQCGDGSDEENCECPEDKFKCGSGECISKSHRCDFDPDCKDASDEMQCVPRDCTANHDLALADSLKNDDSIFAPLRRLISCPHTTACSMKEWECDGENDCWDWSDEKNCTGRKINNVTCNDEQFQCSNGRCIPNEWICDTEPDCQDGNPNSDEKDCQYHCAPDHFSCDNKSLCIPKPWVCDGVNDCVDVSDETQCQNKTKITEPTTCAPYQATCLNGDCISKSQWCDGSFDCSDLTDESEACIFSIENEKEMKRCNETEFTCDNKECIPLSDLCNLEPDCSDRSDEKPAECENYPLYCAKNSSKFLCLSGSCIDANLTCNGLNDCGDFSDELQCNINECEYAACEHNCHDLKIGYECTCNSGFKADKNDTHKCEDINECKDRPCSQLCLNTYGSYHCECFEGYIKDGNRCKIESFDHPKIIFSNRFYIRSVTLDGHAELLLHNLSNAVAIDFDWSRKFIYFSDVTQLKSEIIRVKWDGNVNTSNREVIHQQNLKNPDGIAFDWVQKNLYWCDKGRKTIEVSRDNGWYRKLLIEDKLDEPRAIALDPYRKYLYWTDWGKVPHIGRAGMDGSDDKLIVTGNLGWPNALTISFETNELFFGDAREDFISVCDLDGGNRQVVAHRKFNPGINLHHIFSIAVWEDRVYFSDWESKSIEYCDKYTGKNCGTLLKLIHRPMDLRIFHPIRQRRLKTSSSYENLMRRKSDSKSKDSSKKKFDTTIVKDNPCLTANCSALCLLSPNAPYYKCACPDNFYLADDQKACISNCTAAQFHCKKSMKCIPFFWKCDGQPDCDSNEDEPATCAEFKCEPGQFQCDLKVAKTNVTCLDASQICDGTSQCSDGTDEENCEKYGCFIDTYFQCEKTENSSAFCIPKSKVCDGNFDCPSSNDERNCSRTCTGAQFKCETTNMCIPKVWECDGDADCTDGSDEQSCEARTCFAIEFRCNSGRCIPLHWQCDSETDCPGGEDEEGCEAPVTNTTCEPSYFKCVRSGECIPGRFKCDQEPDCGDFSDEEGCPQRECSESEFKCNDGRCIKGSLRCNKEYNCIDFSDEKNCTSTCDETLMFKCANGNQCINKSFLCDGEADCDDYSDEKNCECSRNEFKCSGEFSKCILNDWICDGVIDCPDKSDEHDSRCLSRGCVGHSNKCTNGKCIPKYLYCDGVDNCGDGFDERNCNIKKTDMTDTKLGCKFGSCSQVCMEKGSKGSIQCKCGSGYHKTGSYRNATCKAIEGQHLIFTASESELRFIFSLDYGAPAMPPRGRIRKIRDTKKTIMPIHSFIKTNSSKITSFDYAIDDDKNIVLFWLDSMPTNNLQRWQLKTANFDEIKHFDIDATVSTILTENKQKNSVLKSLSVDWVTRKIYLIENDMIKAVDFDGNNPRTLVDGGINSWDIIVDPDSRKMFWSTMMRSIYTASMDGSQKRRFIYENIEFASGLAIDYPSRRLYWCDFRKATVETVNLEGRDRQIIRIFDGIDSLTQLVVSPVKLDIFEDDLYVTMSNQTIYKLNKFGWKKDYEELKNGPYRFKASQIKIVHAFKHNSTLPNPCLLYPCDKSAICYLSSIEQHGRSCNCPDNLYIQKNGSHVSCLHRTEIPSLCYKPCLNGGKCKYVNDFEMKCDCQPQFEGESCENFICSEYCKNGGVCSFPKIMPTTTSAELKAKRTCTCRSEFKGPKCDIPASVCAQNNFCLNGGTCQYQMLKNGTISQTCSCPANFSGERCEMCTSIQCVNGGTCRKDTNDRYRCVCSERYTGIYCQADRCSEYCKNNGRCSIKPVKGPACECDDGYSGENCEINDKSCENCPLVMPNCDLICQNGGSCKKEMNGIESCICVGQWSGNHCELPPRCIDNECGKCNDSSSINECLCSGGLIQPCAILNEYSQTHNPDVQVSEMFNNSHQALSVVVILTFAFILMSTLAVIAVFYVRRWQRRVRFFAHARLNENVEEITNPIFDFSATDRDDINLPVTNISSSDEKGNFSNPLYESMYSSSHKGLLEKKSDDEEESKNELL